MLSRRLNSSNAERVQCAGKIEGYSANLIASMSSDLIETLSYENRYCTEQVVSLVRKPARTSQKWVTSADNCISNMMYGYHRGGETSLAPSCNGSSLLRHLHERKVACLLSAC